MTDQTISHYRILEPLGGESSVRESSALFAAEELESGSRVALRVLPARFGREERKRTIRMATAVSQLAHQNLERLLEIGETGDGRLFWASEPRPGETLDRRIDRGALPTADALAIALQLAAGLDGVHRARLIHGALRPDQVRVDDSLRVEILGFGLVAIGGKGLSVRLGDPLVTLSYRSPEQVRGDPISRRADVWSLGVIVYEMIAGRHPFAGSTTGALAESILGGKPRPLSTVALEAPPGLDRVLARALTKEAAKRYPTIANFGRDLKAIAALVGDPAPPRKTKPRKRRRAQRRVAKEAPDAAAEGETPEPEAVESPIAVESAVTEAEGSVEDPAETASAGPKVAAIAAEASPAAVEPPAGASSGRGWILLCGLAAALLVGLVWIFGGY